MFLRAIRLPTVSTYGRSRPSAPRAASASASGLKSSLTPRGRPPSARDRRRAPRRPRCGRTPSRDDEPRAPRERGKHAPLVARERAAVPLGMAHRGGIGDDRTLRTSDGAENAGQRDQPRGRAGSTNCSHSVARPVGERARRLGDPVARRLDRGRRVVARARRARRRRSRAGPPRGRRSRRARSRRRLAARSAASWCRSRVVSRRTSVFSAIRFASVSLWMRRSARAGGAAPLGEHLAAPFASSSNGSPPKLRLVEWARSWMTRAEGQNHVSCPASRARMPRSRSSAYRKIAGSNGPRWRSVSVRAAKQAPTGQ